MSYLRRYNANLIDKGHGSVFEMSRFVDMAPLEEADQ